MLAQPDPEMRKAALAGGPVSQNSYHTQDTSLAARDFQAEKLRRLFCFCEKPTGGLNHSLTTAASVARLLTLLKSICGARQCRRMRHERPQADKRP